MTHCLDHREGLQVVLDGQNQPIHVCALVWPSLVLIKRNGQVTRKEAGRSPCHVGCLPFIPVLSVCSGASKYFENHSTLWTARAEEARMTKERLQAGQLRNPC